MKNIIIAVLLIALAYCSIEIKIPEPSQKEKEEKNVLLNKGCQEGNYKSCQHLGEVYFDGYGLEKNRQKAKELFSKTCDNGNAFGCLRLAMDYNIIKPSKELYIESCKVPYADGCFGLANFYQSDLTMAKNLFSRACDEGNFLASCTRLGDIYNENSIFRDEDKAREYFLKGIGFAPIGFISLYKYISTYF